ncbi:FecR family protein [Caulobacter sp. LARHSG274]
MIKDRKSSARITREAADWLDRLGTPPHETEELEAFSAWRADPDNWAEYERLDDIKRAMAMMRDDPDLRQAADQALARGAARRARQIAPRSRSRLMIGALAAAGLVAAVAVGLTLRLPTYSTGVGQTFSATLEDGSRVQLNTDSAVRVRYGAGERRIELLRGQALFEVAHNPQRPFIVTAGAAQVRALGTRFDVRRLGSEVRVVLAHGSVEITDHAVRSAPWRLKPGQILALAPATPASAAPAPIDVSTATSWTSGKVTFEDVTLADAVAELNRYSRDKIILGERAPAARRVSGVFTAGDNADFIAAVSSLYGLKSVPRASGDIELRPQNPAAS